MWRNKRVNYKNNGIRFNSSVVDWKSLIQKNDNFLRRKEREHCCLILKIFEENFRSIYRTEKGADWKIFSYISLTHFLTRIMSDDPSVQPKDGKYPTALPTRISVCSGIAFKREIWKKIGSCLPLHLNLSSRIESIFRFCALFGDSHLAPDVSMGCAWRYAFSHRRLQSQMNGFLAKCLWKEQFLSDKNPRPPKHDSFVVGQSWS